MKRGAVPTPPRTAGRHGHIRKGIKNFPDDPQVATENPQGAKEVVYLAASIHLEPFSIT